MSYYKSTLDVPIYAMPVEVDLFSLPSASVKGAPKTSMLALLHNIVAQEGVTGLYRGISPNLLKVIPAVTVSYVVYEYTRILLGVDIEGRRVGKEKETLK